MSSETEILEPGSIPKLPEPKYVCVFRWDTGDLLRDKVTGMEGVVMVRAHYSTGCHHYGILPREVVGGTEPDWVWLDQSRLELVESAAVSFDIDPAAISGPQPSGPKA